MFYGPWIFLIVGFFTLPFSFLTVYKNLTISDILLAIAFLFVSLIIVPFNLRVFEQNIIHNNIFLIPVSILGAGFFFSISNAFFPMESITAFFQIIFIFCLIFPLLTMLINNPDTVKELMAVLLISTSLIAIAIFVFSLFNIDLTAGLFLLEKGWGGERFSFGGLEPNVPGRIVLKIIPVSCSFIFIARKRFTKILNLILIIVGMFVIINTGSRSSLLALLCGILLFPFFLKQTNPEISLTRSLLLIGILTIAAGLYFLKDVQFSGIIDRYATIFSVKSSYSSLQRINLVEQAVEYIVQHPLFGAGFENFHFLTDEYITVHNPILAMWAENGIFGMIGFLSIYLILVIFCIKSWQNHFFNDYLLMGMAIMVILMIIGDMFMANSYKRILWVPSILFVHYYNLLRSKYNLKVE